MKLNLHKSWLIPACIVFFSAALTSCGFQPRGELPLAKPLHSMYLQTNDPYGTVTRSLEQSLKMSNVKLTNNPANAKTILAISRDETSQRLLSVSGTQQTRQYELLATVTFQVSDNQGRVIVHPVRLEEKRTITIQSNQILGSSNEATLYLKEMRRNLASAIMYRLSSLNVTKMVNNAFRTVSKPKRLKKPEKKTH